MRRPRGEGVYDMQGGFLGRNMEEAQATVQAQQQAQIEALRASRASAVAEGGGVAPKWEQLDNPLPGQTKENSYVHPETGDIGVYMNQQGQIISQEQFLADQERFKKEAIAGLRRAIGGGSGDLNINVSDDVQVQDAVNASRTALEKQEAAANADLQRQREEAKRYVPARTLRSLESNGGGQP